MDDRRIMMASPWQGRDCAEGRTTGQRRQQKKAAPRMGRGLVFPRRRGRTAAARSALTGLEARVLLVDDVDAAVAAHDGGFESARDVTVKVR